MSQIQGLGTPRRLLTKPDCRPEPPQRTRGRGTSAGTRRRARGRPAHHGAAHPHGKRRFPLDSPLKACLPRPRLTSTPAAAGTATRGASTPRGRRRERASQPGRREASRHQRGHSAATGGSDCPSRGRRERRGCRPDRGAQRGPQDSGLRPGRGADACGGQASGAGGPAGRRC